MKLQLWEYKTETECDVSEDSEFNKLGSSGWEYVAHIPSSVISPGYHIFKRPLSS